MILKFVRDGDGDTSNIHIMDNVRDVTYKNLRERGYIDKNGEPEYTQRIDVCLLTEADVKNMFRNEEEKPYIEFWRISFYDTFRNITISVVFNCSCYVCNNQGKTIDRIGF